LTDSRTLSNLRAVEWMLLKYGVVSLFLASTLYIHFRGRVRHGFGRQLTDHSTFMAPINCLIYFFSGVPNRPYLDLDRLPQLKTLEERWRTIRSEAEALLEAERVRASEKYDDVAFNSFFRRGWKRFHLKWYGDFLPSAKELCPRTIALLQDVPGLNAAMFAFLPAGSRLVKHRDPYAGSLRYHLGLITPNDDRCRISVDGQPYSWRDGEAVLFDETFLHYAQNETEIDRLILFCDVARPMRFSWMESISAWFGRTFVAGARARNQADERIGFINVLFGGFYRVRLIGKRIKKTSRPLYYGLKFGLIGLALVALLY
jgi:beta-hydroxylase